MASKTATKSKANTEAEYNEIALYTYLKSDNCSVELTTTKDATKTLLFKITVKRVLFVNGKENLLISLDKYVNNEVITCSFKITPIDIEKQLVCLREYGTGFLHSEIISVRSFIDKNYRAFPIINVSDLNDNEKRSFVGADINNDIESIVEIINDYVTEHEENAEKFIYDDFKYKFLNGNYYDVPVKAVDSILEGTLYEVYSKSAIRQCLKENRYISTGTNGNTVTAHSKIEEEKNSKKDNEKDNEKDNYKVIAYKALRFLKDFKKS